MQILKLLSISLLAVLRVVEYMTCRLRLYKLYLYKISFFLIQIFNLGDIYKVRMLKIATFGPPPPPPPHPTPIYAF